MGMVLMYPQFDVAPRGVTVRNAALTLLLVRYPCSTSLN